MSCPSDRHARLRRRSATPAGRAPTTVPGQRGSIESGCGHDGCVPGVTVSRCVQRVGDSSASRSSPRGASGRHSRSLPLTPSPASAATAANASGPAVRTVRATRSCCAASSWNSRNPLRSAEPSSKCRFSVRYRYAVSTLRFSRGASRSAIRRAAATPASRDWLNAAASRHPRICRGRPTLQIRTAGPSSEAILLRDPRIQRIPGRPAASPGRRSAGRRPPRCRAAVGPHRQPLKLAGITPNRSASMIRARAALVREPASRASDRTSPGSTRKYSLTLKTGPRDATQASEMIS